ncbi:MAG: gamma-butyrobetaine hydroxylase-like domain-containing protein [Wenzhouxiangella sp.]
MAEPTEIRLERARGLLVVSFDDGKVFELPLGYLRTHSPSAEVRGHGLSEPCLMTGKDEVGIEKIEPIGSYAIALHFDDGHKTGIYSWSFLYDLGINQQANLDRYAERLRQAGMTP